MAKSGDTIPRKAAPKTDVVELGSGAFTAPENKANRARYHFLQCIRRNCPAPLFALRDTIFPLYRDWAESIVAQALEDEAWNQSPEAVEAKVELEKSFRDMGLPDWVAKRAAECPAPQVTSPDAPIFKEFMLMQFNAPNLERVLMEWAQRFNLTHAREFEEEPKTRKVTESGVGEFELLPLALHDQYWVCQWAVQTLWQWLFTDIGPSLMNDDPPHWVRGHFQSGSAGTIPRLPPIALDQAGWDVEAEEQSEFRERIQDAVDAFLDKYIVTAEQAAESRGLLPTKTRKKQDHFDWLALFQVTGCTHQEIAADCRVEAQTVADGINGAASLVGLDRRRGQRGPEPGKTQNSPT